MRVRETTIPYKARGIGYRYLHSPTNWTFSGPLEDGLSSWSFIEDQNNGRNRPKTSPCTHVSSHVQHIPVTGHTRLSNSSYGLGYQAAAPFVSPKTPYYDLEGIDWDEIMEASGRFLNDKYASVAKEVSLFNNLFELDELPGLIKPLQKYRYLDYKFGIEPLYRDLMTLHSNLKNLKARLASLRRSANAPRRFRHLVRNVEVSLPVRPFGVPRLDSRFLKARVYGQFTMTLPALSELDQQIAVLLDALGAHLDVQVWYDATPFSWLLDWILPLGDYLEQFIDRRWYRPTLHLENSMVSLAGTVSGGYYFEPSFSAPDWQGQQNCSFSTRLYVRRSLIAPTNFDKLSNFPRWQYPELTEDKLLVLLGLTKLI